MPPTFSGTPATSGSGVVRAGVSSATLLTLRQEIQTHLGGLAGATVMGDPAITDAVNEGVRECNARGMWLPKVVDIAADGASRLFALPTDCRMVEMVHLEDETGNPGIIMELHGWRPWNDGAVLKLQVDAIISSIYTIRVYYAALHPDLTTDADLCYADRGFVTAFAEHELFDRYLRTGNRQENERHLARLEARYESVGRRAPKYDQPAYLSRRRTYYLETQSGGNAIG